MPTNSNELHVQFLSIACRFHTSTSLTADEIHNLGLEEVARIEGEMQKIVTELGYDMTVPEFSAMIKNDSRFYYETEEDLMNGFESICYDRVRNLEIVCMHI